MSQQPNKLRAAVLLAILSCATAIGLAATPVLAANSALDVLDVTAQSSYDTSQKDPTAIVASLIKYALGFLGIIFMVLTLYAGFLWMTAQGEEEKITTAKNILTGAVIGLIIISLAYAITIFVSSALDQSGQAPATGQQAAPTI